MTHLTTFISRFPCIRVNLQSDCAVYNTNNPEKLAASARKVIADNKLPLVAEESKTFRTVTIKYSEGVAGALGIMERA